LSQDLYEKLGASASKAGLHDALEKAGLDKSTGLFAVINDDIAGDPAYCSVVHCDGAGTKSLIAYLAHQETSDISFYAGLAQDALVMNLDDVMCLGMPTSAVLANAIGRNARIISDDAVAEIIKSYAALVSSLESSGIPIALSGGETADVGDVVRTLMVDAVVTARLKRDTLVNTRSIKVGDAIVGLSSSGQATYENKPNSGIGSNGLTLARHTILSSYYRENFPEAMDSSADDSATYQGPFRITDTPEGLGMNIGEALLSPTRTYAPVLKQIFEQLGAEIHGAIHVTGGGATKVLRFGPGGLCFVKNNLFDPPTLFKLIQEHGKVSWREMYQVFNMGQRLELYTAPENVETIVSISNAFNIECQQIGHVEQASKEVSPGNMVRVESANGTFEYNL
jgi:phosphoribosylformylglycinamidine cyclo-ligase